VVLNWGFLMTARVVGLVSSLVFVVVVARRWGPARYGQYAFVLAFTSCFAFLAGFGLDRVVIQQVAAGGSVSRYLVNSVAARAGLSFLAILCAGCIIRVSARPELFAAAVIAGGSLMASSLYRSSSALFQALERMDLVALVELPFSAGRSAAGIATVLAGHGLVSLLTVYLVVDFLQAVAGLLIAVWAFHPVLEWPRLDMILGLMRGGAPLALWTLSAVVEFRTSTIVLSRYWDDAVVGWYAAPYKVVDMMSIAVLAMSSALLPALVRLFNQSREAFAEVYSIVFRLFLIVLLPFAVGTTILAKGLIGLFFGQAYVNSYQLLQLLAWAAAMMSLQFMGGTALLATGRWGRVPVLGLVVAGTAVLAALLFIPRWGSTGAALGLLLTESVNVCATYVLVWRTTGVWPQHFRLGRLVSSLAVWGVLLWLLRNVCVLIVVVCAIPLYALLVMIFGALEAGDFQLAAALIPQRVYAWLCPKRARVELKRDPADMP
jgi:O-antigen/teichoic acid export membrane protein